MTRITSRLSALLVLLASLATLLLVVVGAGAPSSAQTCTDPYGCPVTTTTTTAPPGNTTTTTAPPGNTTTTTAPPGNTTTTTRGVAPGNDSRGGNLARTGFTVLGLLVLAAILLVFGKAMVEASRRRHRPTAS